MSLFQPCENKIRSVVLASTTWASNAESCAASNNLPLLSNSTSKTGMPLMIFIFLHRLNCAHEIDQTVTFEVALAAERRCAVDEDAFDVVGPTDEFAANGQECGDRT